MKAMLMTATAAMMLSGCFNRSAILAMPGAAGALPNGRVRVMRCWGNGWGLMGAPQAKTGYEQCVKDAKAMGYTVEMSKE